MQQFDEYINKILSGLNISKSKKAELSDEFLDHLNMLKKEFMEEGMAENSAAAEAIKAFGENEIVRAKLAKDLSTYRSYSNIIIGLIITFLIYRGGSRVPIPGISFWNQVRNVGFFIYSIIGLSAVLFFIPAGYFMPIIFKRVNRAIHVVLGGIIAGLLFGIYCAVAISPDLKFLPIGAAGGIIGSMLGYGLLNLISRAVCRTKNNETKYE